MATVLAGIALDPIMMMSLSESSDIRLE